MMHVFTMGLKFLVKNLKLQNKAIHSNTHHSSKVYQSASGFQAQSEALLHIHVHTLLGKAFHRLCMPLKQSSLQGMSSNLLLIPTDCFTYMLKI